MIKLIIFDLWQTLAYRDVPYGTISKILKATHSKIPKDKFVKIFEASLQTKKWRSKYRAYANLCHNMHLPASDKNIKLLINIRDKAEAKTKLFPYTVPLLKRLKKLGYKTGLISNSSVFAIKQIKKIKIFKLIDHSLFSYQVGIIKPNLKIFKTILKMAKCKPAETIMIGDKIGDDVVPPKKLGMHAIHFTSYQNLKTCLKKYNIYL